MWPFTLKRAAYEQDVLWRLSRGEWDELIARMKTLEREADDLHAAYRRLRGGMARDQVGKGQPGPPKDYEEAPGAFDKAALRRQYLGKGPRGNGQP